MLTALTACQEKAVIIIQRPLISSALRLWAVAIASIPLYPKTVFFLLKNFAPLRLCAFAPLREKNAYGSRKGAEAQRKMGLMVDSK